MTDIEEEKQWKEWLNNRSDRVQTKILNHINNGMDRDESMFRVLKAEFILFISETASMYAGSSASKSAANLAASA